MVLGGRALAVVEGDARARGSSSVLSEIDEALGRARVSLREVDLFAVADGPGSFTGLRAGLATAKAFAETLGRPLVGVHTLHALASAAGEAGRVLALIPAGRGEFFSQLLNVEEGGAVSELGQAVHAGPEEVLGSALELDGRLTWTGEGARLLDERLREGVLPHARSHRLETLAHRAEGREWVLAGDSGALSTEVARLALRAYGESGPITPGEVRAFYVRASDAELKERCRA